MSDPAPARDPSRRQLEKLETIIAILDEVVAQDELSEVGRVIARGFVELGAVMVGLFVLEDGYLRPVARWPEEAADALFAQLHPSGGRLPDFRIPVEDGQNPYVQVLRSQVPKVIRGPDEVADHIMRTYGGPESIREPLIKALYGKASAVVPLVAGEEAVGVAGLNYAETLGESELHLFNIFARSAATLINLKHEVVSREAILAELERALVAERETREELNRAGRLHALGEMSAIVAHEIRNPLAVIKNSASSLRRYVGDAQEAQLLCEILDEETARIERIIDDMLAFSTPLEVGGKRLAVQEIVDKAIYLVGERSTGQSVVEVHHESDDLPPVVVDLHRVSHALVNLIDNARQATRKGGKVEVRTARVTLDGRPFVRIEVVDGGVGIAPEHIGHVFQPFFTTKEDGTGLGLAQAQRVVDAHGGRLSIASTLGQGTVVSLDLPCAEPDFPSESEGPLAGQGPPHPRPDVK